MEELLVLVCLASLPLLASTAGGSQEEEGALLLTGENGTFDEFIKSQLEREGKPSLVMFHVDWCKVCQRVYPEFQSGAYAVLHSTNSMNFAHVDCGTDKPLCQRFGAKGYPTLSLFDVGGNFSEPLTFRGVRTKKGFQDYAARMTRPHVLRFGGTTAAADFSKQIRAENFSAVLSSQPSRDGHPDASFSQAARILRDKHVFALLEEPVAKAISTDVAEAVGAGSLFVYSQPRQQWSAVHGSANGALDVFRGDLEDSAALISWLKARKFPGVWRLDESNFWDFVRADRSAVIVAVNPAASNEPTERAIRDAAKEFTDQFSWGILDGVAWADSLVDLNVRTQDLPRVFVIEDHFESWVEDIEGLNVPTLRQGLRAVVAGTLLRQSRGFSTKPWFWMRESKYGLQGALRYMKKGPLEAASIFVLLPAMVAFNLAIWLMAQCFRALMEEPHSHVD